MGAPAVSSEPPVGGAWGPLACRPGALSYLRRRGGGLVSDHSMFATPLQIELQDECISEVCPKSRCGVLAKEPASGMLSLRLQRSRVAKAPGRLRCPFHGAHQQVVDIYPHPISSYTTCWRFFTSGLLRTSLLLFSATGFKPVTPGLKSLQ